MADLKPLNLDSEEKQPDQPQEAGGVTTVKDNLGGKKMGKQVLILVILGVISGYALTRVTGSGDGAGALKRSVDKEDITQGTTVGVKDEEAFRDIAEGKLLSGGIDGEGSHHLERPGGESQNVYVTSSIIDLDQFVDRKVKVWGETFEAQKAGWLMDVGRLEVLE